MYVCLVGLITSKMTGELAHHKKPYAHAATGQPTTLLEAVKLVKPTSLIGVSAQGQAFTKQICGEMTGKTILFLAM